MTKSISIRPEGDQPMGVHHKMLEVMRLVNYIKKDKRNTFHNYDYASDEAIKRAIHEALAEVGLVFSTSIVSVEREKGFGKTGGESLTTVTMEYFFTDPETKEGTTPQRACGTGCDSMDKGLYKAITGALKYALTSTFLIPTGDDPEGETKDDRKEYKEAGKRAQQAVAADKLAQFNQQAEADLADSEAPDTRTVAETLAHAPIIAPGAPSASPTPIVGARPKPKTLNYDFLKQMKVKASQLGRDRYYAVLGGLGYAHSNEITKPEAQDGALTAMSQAVQDTLKEAELQGGGKLYDKLADISKANTLYWLGKQLKKGPAQVDAEVLLALETNMTYEDCLKEYKGQVKAKEKPSVS